jgi:hypothetical protein
MGFGIFPVLLYSMTPMGLRYGRNKYLIFLRSPRPSRFFSSNQIRRSQFRENQAKDVEVLIHW